ncbi:MAG: DJ-1/PfpI family protein [Blastocatellia bacterium]|nr:DJ-1/PfpI family protein [Blastocatellia bacterium]
MSRRERPAPRSSRKTPASSVLFDAVCVPGAAASAQRLAAMPEAVEFLQQAYKHCKAIGAIGAGKDVLAAASIPGTDAAALRPASSWIPATRLLASRRTSRPPSPRTGTGRARTSSRREHCV